MRWTFYVDLDAYYVACEVRDRPELVGRAVIVGPDPKLGPTRGVVLSASYEARKFGVRSAMPASRAAALAPEAIWVRPDFQKYERTAHEVRALLRKFSSVVVPLSIDEAALEVEAPDAESAGRFGGEVQSAIRTELQLSASLGIAPHRTVAKIASDLRKPGGLVVVPPETTAAFLAPLPARAIPGIGPKTEERMTALGIRTVADLAAYPRAKLRKEFGAFADELQELANGRPKPSVLTEGGPQLRSTDRTFAEDVGELDRLLAEARRMGEELFAAVAEEHLRGESVGVALRWADFSRSQRSRTVGHAIEAAPEVTAWTDRLLRGLWAVEQQGRRRKVRTLSVRLERLRPTRARQARLEGYEAPSEPPR
jgi:nucleotidyltransferase/DNA polymerase involved in DNA repair